MYLGDFLEHLRLVPRWVGLLFAQESLGLFLGLMGALGELFRGKNSENEREKSGKRIVSLHLGERIRFSIRKYKNHECRKDSKFLPRGILVSSIH